MTRGLLVVDVQEDFCEGGSLAVAGGRAVARAIRGRLADADVMAGYQVTVASQDWHVDPGGHFAEHPDLVDSWPAHCVVGTGGARLQAPLTEDLFSAVVRKGERTAAYSAFEGTVSGGTPLAEWLAARGIDALDVCGLATDYCVRASALDALRAGLAVRLLQELIAGVAPETSRLAVRELRAAGVELA